MSKVEKSVELSVINSLFIKKYIDGKLKDQKPVPSSVFHPLRGRSQLPLGEAQTIALPKDEAKSRRR